MRIVNQKSNIKNQKWGSRLGAAKGSSIRELMQEGTRLLEEAGVGNARAEIELILSEATGLSRSELYLDASAEAAPRARILFERAVDLRKKRFPLQYITRRQGFRYLDIQVSRGVFIPRPETELVVEEALKAAKRMEPPLVVADVGTGSGAIALSIASELEEVKVFALDVSSRALSMARRNALIHHLNHKICFLKSNLLSSLPQSLKGKMDLVVANPPYVAKSLLRRLQPELAYEPSLALDGGEDGLRFYPPLVNQAYAYLKPKGALVVELGESAAAVKDLLVSAGFSEIDVLPDLNGCPRIAIGYKST